MMANSKYRQAMLQAFSFPLGLFVIFAFSLILFFGPCESGHVIELLFALAALLAPLYLTGLLLAPWAGRRIETTKGPAFLMASASALCPAVALGIAAAFSGGISLALGTAAFFALFALPASVLGAILFIGACERLHATASPERMPA